MNLSCISSIEDIVRRLRLSLVVSALVGVCGRVSFTGIQNVNMMDNDTMTKGVSFTAALLLTNDAMVFYYSEFVSNKMG